MHQEYFFSSLLELWRYNHEGEPLHPNHDPVEHDAFSSLGEYAYTHQKQHEAVTWIDSHPFAFARRSGQRVMEFWFDYSRGLKFMRRGGAWFYRVKLAYVCVLLILVLGGLVALWRKRREYFWLLASFPVVFPLLYYFTLARDFHRYPIDPILAIIGAFAMLQLLKRKAVS